jgi:hypothetical protein
MRQIPDVLVGFDSSKGGHPAQTNSIFYNPEHFAIRVLLHCCTSGDVRSEACGYIVPAFFPIMFELTILFSAFTAFFGRSSRDGIPPAGTLIKRDSEPI